MHEYSDVEFGNKLIFWRELINSFLAEESIWIKRNNFDGRSHVESELIPSLIDSNSLQF